MKRLLALFLIGISFFLSACGDSDDENESEIHSACPPLTDDELGTTAQVISIPPAGQIYHAVFVSGVTDWGEEDDMILNDLRSYEQQVGKPAAWVYFSHNWFRSRDFPVDTASWIRDAGSVPFIRLMLRSDAIQGDAEPTFTLDRILAGDFDVDTFHTLHRQQEFTRCGNADFKKRSTPENAIISVFMNTQNAIADSNLVHPC